MASLDERKSEQLSLMGLGGAGEVEKPRGKKVGRSGGVEDGEESVVIVDV